MTYNINIRLMHVQVKKVNGAYTSSSCDNLKVTGRHLPYGITQCYLPPDTSELNVPHLTPASKLVLHLPIPEGWKAELT